MVVQRWTRECAAGGSSTCPPVTFAPATVTNASTQAVSGRPLMKGPVFRTFSTRVNGYTRSIVTRLDVLDTMPALKICTAYELNGEKIDYFPASAATLEKCQPIYEELPGWQTPISDIRDFAQLPLQARQYLARLEELIACPISVISVGMRREQTIFKSPVW